MKRIMVIVVVVVVIMIVKANMPLKLYEPVFWELSLDLAPFPISCSKTK